MRLFFNTLILVMIVYLPYAALAQKEGYIWAFGDKAGLDFNTGVPVAISTAMDNQFCGNATVSTSSGALLFYTDGNRIWNYNHNVMPNGVLLTTNFGSSSAGTWAVNQSAVIVPVPGDTTLYYVFSLEIYTGGYRLWYSIVDIRLDNGQGDVTQRPVLLDPGALTEAMTVVRGEQCNYWLLVHQKYSDQFRAYNINASGVNPAPVISHAGTLGAAIFSFGNYNLGGMKISPDGRKLSGNWSASGLSDYYLELYDFDPATGSVSNAMRLDGPYMYHYNTCFSPDNSKLYSTGNGYLHQFDVSLQTAAAIAASKTDLFGGRFIVTHGDLKRGPDDKIYLALRGTGAMHRINFPNLAGAACSVQTYVLPLVAGTNANWGLPNENMTPLPPEQVITSTRYTSMCNPDSLQLSADTPGRNYVWYDYGRTRQITVYAPGVYIVRYSNDCTHHLDTFVVLTHPVFPSLFNNGFSCANDAEGMAWLVPSPGDTTNYNYTWMDSNGQVIKTGGGIRGDTARNLQAGDYRVRVNNAFGCDSMYEFTILSLPAPEISFDVKDTICEQQPLPFRNTSPEELDFIWTFGDGTQSRERDPEHIYSAPGRYAVVLEGRNSYGCREFFSRSIEVGKQDFLHLEADQAYADKGRKVLLYTHARDAYSMIAWLPPDRFISQNAYRQEVIVDSTQEYIAVGRSVYGCIDSAAIIVHMNPVLFLPNAFTPNGDGINDYFGLAAKGEIGVIRYFMIYNRWGENIWNATGEAAKRGWDGYYRGAPVETGVYYYHIEVQAPSGKQYTFKGEVTLLR